MDTYGEIIVKLDRILMILPHFLSHVPAAGGRRRRRRRVRAASPSRRRRPQPIEEGRPESTFITDGSFEEEKLTSSSAASGLNFARAHDVGRCGEDEALGGRDAASSSEPMWRA